MAPAAASWGLAASAEEAGGGVRLPSTAPGSPLPLRDFLNLEFAYDKTRAASPHLTEPLASIREAEGVSSGAALRGVLGQRVAPPRSGRCALRQRGPSLAARLLFPRGKVRRVGRTLPELLQAELPSPDLFAGHSLLPVNCVSFLSGHGQSLPGTVPFGFCVLPRPRSSARRWCLCIFILSRNRLPGSPLQADLLIYV